MITVELKGVGKTIAVLKNIERNIPIAARNLRKRVATKAANYMSEDVSKKAKYIRYRGHRLRNSFKVRSYGKYTTHVYSTHKGAWAADRGAPHHPIPNNPWGPFWTPKYEVKPGVWMHRGSRPLNYVYSSFKKVIREVGKDAEEIFSINRLVKKAIVNE